MTILLLTFLSFLLLSAPAWTEHKGTKLLGQDGLRYYPFHEDPVNGPVVRWYANGQMQREANFKDGKKHGLSTFWYENGQKYLEGSFKDGKQNGPWTGWDKHGNITRQTTYRNGHEVCILQTHL